MGIVGNSNASRFGKEYEKRKRLFQMRADHDHAFFFLSKKKKKVMDTPFAS